MPKTSQEFGNLLRTGVHRIALRESKTIQVVQDELGFALKRASGSAIDFWRKGNIPTNADVAQLAREIIRRSDLQRDWLERFLRQGMYVEVRQLCDELFPSGRGDANERLEDRRRSFGSAHTPVEQLAPFVTGSPIIHPRQFWGREREVRNVLQSLIRIPMRNTAIIGPQRSGKTSLLHFLRQITTTQRDDLRPDQSADKRASLEGCRWVFVDFQDARMTSQERLLRHLLSGLELNVPEPCTLNSFLDVMADGLRVPAVLLFDEIGVALEQEAFDQSFWWSMRSLVTNLAGGRLSFIVTSQQSPQQHAEAIGKPSPFFNIFYRLDLGPLTVPEAQALIASSPLPFAPTEVEWILSQSRCWPALVQILCHVRLAALENDEAGTLWQDEGLRQIAHYQHLFAGS